MNGIDNTIDSGKIGELIKIIEDKENLIRKFFEDNGFNCDNGDLLILPIDYEIKNLKHPNICYTQFMECPVLTKKSDLYQHLRESYIKINDQISQKMSEEMK